MRRRIITKFSWLSLAVLISWPSPGLGQPGEEDEGRQKQVMERFLGLLEKTPRRGTALDRVYSYHVDHGTIEAFVNGYRERTIKAPSDGNAWLLLGLFEAQRGRDAAAVTALREAEKHLPDSPLPSYYLGQSLVMVGQPDAAAEAFERSIARKPIRTDLLEIFQALGKVHQRARRFDQALAVWNRLERLLPDDLRVQEQIAQALVDEGQFAEALPKLESLAKKVKDPHRQIQLKMEASDLKVRLGRTTEALADFEGLLGRLNPDAWLYREARRKLEDIFLRNDDLAGLANYYEQWLKKTPDDLDAITRLGRFLALQGRSAEARQWLDKAVKLAPSRKEIRLALIEQLVKQGLIADAAAQYEAIVERDPNNPDTLREWGRLLLKDTARPEADRKAAAAKVWQRLADAKKDDAVSVAQAADLFRQAEMADQAIAYYKKAVELAPESPQYREYLGEYYQSLKRTDDAIATWLEIASGSRRNVKSLARLSEILAGFGHLKPAIKAGEEAIGLDKKDPALRLKQASFLQRDGRLSEAAEQLDVAAKQAETADEKEEVLRLQLENYQAAGTLTAEIEKMSKTLEAGKKSTADDWLRLARLWEVDRKLPEALDAVKQALEIDVKSVTAWATAARLHETAGDLLAAANEYRKLVLLDRRERSEYLINIAKLEARLGRRTEALQAGRDLLASAPGNAENYQVFADLCFQLGANDEGLETLRRSLRLNPSDSKVLMNLAEALGRQFRIDEAIEIYWRALARTNEIDAKINVVSKLAELYLQRNQFDRLIGRLGRELGNPDQQRELAICLSQAYSSAGDYGLARQELERLLAANARDTQLLKQLSILAETEGSLGDASKFQRQLNDLAPSEEGTSRLAQLYVKSGDMNEAESLWEKISAEDQDTHRVLQAIDSLLGNAKPEAALTITGRLLRAKPDDWEALYREGVALIDLNRADEASQRFRTLLNQTTPDDTLSAIVKARRKSVQPQTANTPWAQAWRARKFPLLYRTYSVYQIRQMTGLEARNYYGSTGSTWDPADFGEARMAALTWLFRLAEKKGIGDAYVKEVREAAAAAGPDARPRWNWFYLQMAREQARGVYEAARDLARSSPQDANAQWCLLHWLRERTTRPGGYSYRPTGVGVVETTPPLAPNDLELVLSAYRTLRLQHPELVHADILMSVDTELVRAQREKDREEFYHNALSAISDPGSLGSVLGLAAERGNVKDTLELFDKFDQSNAPQSAMVAVFMSGGGDALARLMNARAQVKAHDDIPRILDHYVHAMQQRTPQTRRSRMLSHVYNRPYYYIWIGKEQNYTTIEFPVPNDHIDHDGILVLRNAFELFRRDEKLPVLFDHLRQVSRQGNETERIDAHLLLAYLHWWHNEKDRAIQEITEAAQIRPADPELKLTQAEILEKNNDPAGALKWVDAVEPLDQRMMQRRELLALRLAVLTGNIERARLASERLFGLRLDVSIQSKLADQMDQLGMHELAEAILGRARRRAGNGTAAILSLMRQYQRQNRTELAVQVALQILRRGGATTFNPYASFYASEDEQARKEAISTLARAGRLKGMIERLEAQIKTAPTSLPLLQGLAEYLRVDGQQAKAHATYKQILALRPNDLKLRFQIACDLLDDGETQAAIDHFRLVLKTEPSLFRYRIEDILSAFRQVQKIDDLIALFQEVDFRAFGHPYYATQVIQSLLKEKDPKRRQAIFGMVRKALEAFPNESMYILGQIKDEEIWQLPEILEHSKRAVIPPSDEPLDTVWHGLDDVIEYANDGRCVGLCTRLIEVAAHRNGLRPLLADVEAGLKQFPAWLGGQALRAAILAHLGEPEQALSLLQPIINDPKNAPSTQTMWFLAQEIEGFSATVPLAITLMERASKETDQTNAEHLRYHPARRLAAIYERVGRASEARALLMALGQRKVTRYPNALTNQQIAVMNAQAIGRELLDLHFPPDSASVYQRILDDREAIVATQTVYASYIPLAPPDYLIKRFESSLKRTQEYSSPQTSHHYIRTLLGSPGNEACSRALAGFGKNAGFAKDRVDLMLEVEPRSVDRAQLRSSVAELFRQSSASTRKPILDDLARLRREAPDDVSLLVLTTLLSLEEGSADLVDPALQSLSEWLEKHPLSPLASADRATTAQRTEAASQVALLLISRRMQTRAEWRPQADRLRARALEAADRVTDPLWSLAILREQGEIDLARGDRDSARGAWNSLLERLLKPIRQNEAGSKVPVATPDRFRQASEFAQLTVANEMPDLALQALREVLRGGPPIQPLIVSNDTQRNSMLTQAQSEDSRNAVARDVEQTFATLDPLWEKAKANPVAVYETLREVVLTEARPDEVFLYERPLSSGGIERPRSVASLLVRWGHRSGRMEDLKGRAVAHRKEPRAEVPSLVLLGQVGLETADIALTREVLNALTKLLTGSAPQSTAEQACLIAIPALQAPEVRSSALAVLEATSKTFANGLGEEPTASLSLILARDHHAQGQIEETRKALRNYATALDRAPSSVKGDAALSLRKANSTRLIREQLQLGLLSDALDGLGQFCETAPPKSGDPPLGDILTSVARQLAARPLAERFQLLKAWSLPTAERKSVRLLAGFAPAQTPPALFGIPALRDTTIVSTADLLIAAANEAGALNTLSDEAEKAAAAQLPNAEAIATLVQLARGRFVEAQPRLKTLLAKLPGKIPAEPETTPTPPTWSDVLIARSCLRSNDTATRGAGEALARVLLDHAHGIANTVFPTLLNRSLAEARVAENSDRPIGSNLDSGFALWNPTSIPSTETAEDPSQTALWVENEGMIGHIGGSTHDLLLLSYPLTGSFTFSARVSTKEYEQGHLSYGGWVFEPLSPRELKSPVDAQINLYLGVHLKDERSGHVGLLGDREPINRSCRSFLSGDDAELTLEVTPEKLRCLVNGHLYFENDQLSGSSPWLGLYAGSGRSARFRNLSLQGSPVIPREVPLSVGERLDGWITALARETLPRRLASGMAEHPGRKETPVDWSCKNGEIQGHRLSTPASLGVAPSLLAYHRPVQDGETIRYEFFAKPGESEAHPTLGSLAFLLEPEGVRLRWVSDRADFDWTGLPADNAQAATESRRGPARLPIRSDDWNQVAVAVAEGRVTLDLNGVRLFEHPLEPGQSRRFGLYHDKNRTTAKVRKVVLTGRWPESVTPEQLAHLTSLREGVPQLDAKQRKAMMASSPKTGDSPKVELPTLDHWTPVSVGGSHALVFDRPLQGDFTISAELALDRPELELGYGGIHLGVSADRKHYRWTNGGRSGEVKLDPPLPADQTWCSAQLQVKGQDAVLSIAGRSVRVERLPDQPEPWLVISGLPPNGESIRQVKISGRPTVPDKVKFSSLSGMAGWTPDPRIPDPGENAQPLWAWQGEDLVGITFADIHGSHQESRLVYQRPALQEGEISYEFFMEPDARMVHPAMGRRVFLLTPQGIETYDLAGHGALKEDSASHKSVAKKALPLKPNDWNQLQIKIGNGTLGLKLNGETVLEQPWKADASSQFALFHFLDETEARVRRITYQGTWPKTPPEP